MFRRCSEKHTLEGISRISRKIWDLLDWNCLQVPVAAMLVMHIMNYPYTTLQQKEGEMSVCIPTGSMVLGEHSLVGTPYLRGGRFGMPSVGVFRARSPHSSSMLVDCRGV
jgi:hypothetical protein